MKKRPEATDLRKRAEKRLIKKPLPPPAKKDLPDDAKKLIHELRVHQVELEMQNDELRKAQGEIEESRSRYVDLYDFSPVGYFTFGETGKVLAANLAGARLVHLERSRLVNGIFTLYLEEKSRRVFREHLKSVLKSRRKERCELRLAGPSPVFISMESICADEPEGATVRSAASDITERRKAGEEVFRLNAELEGKVAERTVQLEAANKALRREIGERARAEKEKERLEARLWQARKAESLGRMAAAVAHHYNNLMAVVMAAVELALLKLPDESGVEDDLRLALGACRRAAETGGQMLAYLGQSLEKRETVDLSAVCREALDSAPGVRRVKRELPPSGPIVRAGAGQIKQAVLNLVANAVEALEGRGGEISVSVEGKPGAEIRAPRFHPADWKPEAGDYACLSVADTGCGMDGETLDRAFDPFFSTKFIGRGLGLAVVEGLAKSLGGAVAAESKPGRGSVFRVFLPAAPEPSEPGR